MNAQQCTVTKINPGDDMHLTCLMAPYSLNLVTGDDRRHLLAFGRAAFDAGRAAMAEPAALDGWKLVPMEPTQGMLEAMDAAINRIAPSSKIWRESVAAAPAPAPAAQAKRPENCGTSFCSCIECVMPVSKYGGPELQALILAKLTAPVERKPLTEAKITELWATTESDYIKDYHICFARELEAAHGISQP